MKNWMEKKCLLVEVGDSMAGAMDEYSAFKAQFHGSAGKKQLACKSGGGRFQSV